MALALCGALAACGTSSSAARGSLTTTPGSIPPSSPLNPVDYDNKAEFASIRATAAYDNIRDVLGSDTVPGEGVTIGVLDSGIDIHHEAFAGKSIREIFLGSARDEDGSRFSHGTAVASVAAAVPSASSDGLQGVAPGADLVAFAIPLGSPPSTYSPISLNSLESGNTRWQDYMNQVLAQDIDILNLSIGFSGIIENYSEEVLRAHFADALASMAQADSDDPVLMVWAAGNAHGRRCDARTDNCAESKINASSVEILAGLVARIEELQGHTVAVIAKSEDSEIARFSNRCGIAADYCILAPGESIAIARFDSDGRGYDAGNGTSYAAPMVSGGLALIMQRFREQLSSREVLSRLFATANKEGEYANHEIYGQGLMDLGAATTEVGTSSVILAGPVDTPGALLGDTRLLFGPAFGASALQSIGGREVAAFDSLGAPFWHSLNSLVSVRVPSISTQLRRTFADGILPGKGDGQTPWNSVTLSDMVRLGFTGRESEYSGLGGPALAANWTSPGSPVALSLFTTEGSERQLPITGTSIYWKPFGLSAGLLAERSSLLGTVTEGGFGRMSANSLFAGLHRSFSASAWRLEAEVETGVSNSSFSHGMLTGMQPVTASRFALNASRKAGRGRSGRIRLSLEQPLRVERSRAEFRAPIGRTKAGEVVFERWQADLAPAGRQIDMSAWWHAPDSGSGRLGFGVIYSRHPGHDADAAPSLSLLAKLQLMF